MEEEKLEKKSKEKKEKKLKILKDFKFSYQGTIYDLKKDDNVEIPEVLLINLRTENVIK